MRGRKLRRTIIFAFIAADIFLVGLVVVIVLCLSGDAERHDTRTTTFPEWQPQSVPQLDSTHTTQSTGTPSHGIISIPPGMSEGVSGLAPLPVGRPAPDFTLTRLDSDRPMSLSNLTGHKPVVLIFRSFT